jgi:hypothetical protein
LKNFQLEIAMKEVIKPRLWILGAGFSRHAGGPLLNDLFSETAEYYFEDAQLTHQAALKKIGRLFREKVFKPNGSSTGCFWAHAEEFLEKIDLLAETGSPRSLVEMFVSHCSEAFLKTPEQLRWYARSRICKEVDDYIHKIPSDSERLQRVGKSRQSVWFQRIGQGISQCFEVIPFDQFGDLVQALVQAFAVLAFHQVFCRASENGLAR